MNRLKKYRKFLLILGAMVVITGAIITVATAFSGPENDPSATGFQSPCARALSKDDNCTFDRVRDSLEAISDKINNK